MQRHHTGSGRRSVIPLDWATHHAVVVSGTHPSTVEIGDRATQRAFNRERGQTETTRPDPVYAGPATLMLASDVTQQAVLAEQDVTTALYQVTLPVETDGIEVQHIVTVSACDDGDLTGATLSVRSVEYGSRRFSRVLYAALVDPHTDL